MPPSSKKLRLESQGSTAAMTTRSQTHFVERRSRPVGVYDPHEFNPFAIDDDETGDGGRLGFLRGLHGGGWYVSRSESGKSGFVYRNDDDVTTCHILVLHPDGSHSFSRDLTCRTIDDMRTIQMKLPDYPNGGTDKKRLNVAGLKINVGEGFSLGPTLTKAIENQPLVCSTEADFSLTPKTGGVFYDKSSTGSVNRWLSGFEFRGPIAFMLIPGWSYPADQ